MVKSLFGYGGTNKAIAKSGGFQIYDDSFKGSEYENGVRDEWGNLLLNPLKFDPNLSDLELVTPGMPPHNELVKKAKNLISEYDYYAKFMPKSIWISGTNGKTTTTKMTQWLLEKNGSVMGGNVGTPLADLVPQNAQIWVLETSSFTLHYTKTATPDLYILLPITPDHISWHGSMKEYEKAKLKPLEMMKNGVAIVPEIYAGTPSKAKIYGYKNESDLAALFGLNLDFIKFKPPFLMDAVLALCAENLICGAADYGRLNSFVIEPHKLEEFNDRFGRVFVDDTKATNIDAALQAIKRYKNKTLHIILGGDDKGVDLSPLFVELGQSFGDKAVIYAIGSNTGKIAELAAKFELKCEICELLENAVLKMSQNMKKPEISNSGSNLDPNSNASQVLNLSQDLSDSVSEIGLLSPACASLDQFKNYAQRGDKFKEFVGKL